MQVILIPRRTWKWLWPVAAMALCPILNSCRKAGAEDTVRHGDIPTVPVVSPWIEEVAHEQSFVASLRGAGFIELKSRVTGLVEEVLVEEGARVTAGQHLFTVGSRVLAAELAKSEAELKGNIAEAKVEELEVENTRSLHAKGIVSKAELDLAEAKHAAVLARVAESEAAVAAGKLGLDYAKVSAPADGVIGRIPNKAGSRVDEGDDLTAFCGDGVMHAYFHASEWDALEMSRTPGLFQDGAAKLILADGSEYPLKGRIDASDPVVAAGTGSVSYRVAFENPEGILKHGGTCRITLTAMVPDALVIPQKSTFEIQHKLCVYVLGEDGIVRLRPVEPSFRQGNCFVIRGGLGTGDRVVFEGIQLVREGDAAMAEVREPGRVEAF
ncbi:efflux RND transporter periplasmic adaptor subunit [Luteolibacter flavescens]|uniref:Efflux RND transporter periplasmic adaptor subunit n=2 Tax=Luteolibacter flavescens TaxID=1859460 RepID=A0ABT3FIS5_9BACT|nr:efflux RND transporter periplasmic adaptor subunit [Luteolibacter flavescens]